MALLFRRCLSHASKEPLSKPSLTKPQYKLHSTRHIRTHMEPTGTTWKHLPADLRLQMLAHLPLASAIALNTASPTPEQTLQIRMRIKNIQPLRDAWVNATQPTLNTYANPPHLRSRSARQKLTPAQFTSVHTLPLSGTSLSSLEGIHEFHALQVLDVSNNELTHVDEGIRKCTELSLLHMGRNKLSAFPDVVLQLPLLKTLLLHHNKLVHLPTEWAFVPHLHRLGLFDCGIVGALPEQLCSMLGTHTDARWCRSANLARNNLDRDKIKQLFLRFPRLGNAVLI